MTPRVDPHRIPFDPKGFIKQLPDWENVDDKWGFGEK